MAKYKYLFSTVIYFYVVLNASSGIAQQAGNFDTLPWQVLLVKDGDFSNTKVYGGNIANNIITGTFNFTDADITMTATDIGSDRTSWRLSVLPKNGYGVYEVQFPILDLDKYGANDRLIWPNGTGVAIDNPFSLQNRTIGSSPRVKDDVIAYGIYPSNSQSMQFFIHDNGDSTNSEGLMVWAKDPSGSIKEFNVKRESSTELRAWISHFPENTGQPGAAWNDPYEVITAKYDGDTYHHPILNYYRPWALNQKWANNGNILEQINANKLPSSYEKNIVWMIAMGHAFEDQRRTDVLRNLLVANEISDVRIGEFTTQWMKHEFDTLYPDYFPPRAPSAYSNLIDLQSEIDNPVIVYPYMNSLIVEDFPGNTSLITEGKMNGPPQGIKDIWAGKNNPGARFNQTNYSFTFNSRPFIPLSPADISWQQKATSIVHDNFTQYLTGGHYLDQLNRNSLAPSFNTNDGHLPGFGSWFMDNLRAHVTNFKYPDLNSNTKLLMGEGISEATVDLVHDNYIVKPNHQDDNLIPLFNLVYSEFTSINGWNMYPPEVSNLSSFSSSLAYSIHQGNKIGAFRSVDTWAALLKPTDSNFNQQSQDFLVETIKVLHKNLHTVVYGRLHVDPQVELADNIQQVTWYNNKSGSDFQLYNVPKIRASLFKNSNSTEVVLLLSNTTSSTLYPIVKTSQINTGTTLYTHTGGQISYSKIAGIEIPPYSWLALSTSPY